MKTADELARLRADILFRASLGGQDLGFHTTWGLFSPRGIDEGTRLLVERLEIPTDADCLDLATALSVSPWPVSRPADTP